MDNITFLDASRDSNGNFTFGNIDIFTSFGSLRKSLNYSRIEQNTNQSLFCLAAKYKYKYPYLELFPKDCRSYVVGAVCRKYQKAQPVKCNSTSSFVKKDTLNFILDPSLQVKNVLTIK